MFGIAVVNQPSVFEPLKFFCISFSVALSVGTGSCKTTEFLQNCELFALLVLRFMLWARHC